MGASKNWIASLPRPFALNITISAQLIRSRVVVADSGYCATPTLTDMVISIPLLK